jgi:hypothetical protein
MGITGSSNKAGNTYLNMIGSSKLGEL